NSRAARLPPPPGLLFPRPPRGGGTSGRQNHQALLGARADDGRRRRRAALPPRAHASGTAASPPVARAQSRLAGLVPSAAQRGTRQRQRRSDRDQPAAGLAGLPSTGGYGNHARKRLGDLDPP